jgi:hypothetical protein
VSNRNNAVDVGEGELQLRFVLAFRAVLAPTAGGEGLSDWGSVSCVAWTQEFSGITIDQLWQAVVLVSQGAAAMWYQHCCSVCLPPCKRPPVAAAAAQAAQPLGTPAMMAAAAVTAAPAPATRCCQMPGNPLQGWVAVSPGRQIGSCPCWRWRALGLRSRRSSTCEISLNTFSADILALKDVAARLRELQLCCITTQAARCTGNCNNTQQTRTPPLP